MDTKEKKQTKPAPKKRPPVRKSASAGKKRSAGSASPDRAAGKTAVKRPKAPPVQQEGDEVYIPGRETREEHNRPERQSGGYTEPRRANPPQGKASAEKRRRPADDSYQPYRKAEAARKKVRSENFILKTRKFFSSENPVLKMFQHEDPAVFGEQGADANAVRRAKRQAEKEKRRKSAERWNMPATMYIEPVPFNSRRLLIQLTTMLAVVIAVVMGMSVFFRVKVITVTGANVYNAWTVREKSGISLGENLLTFGRTKASGQIIANLPYVKSARIGIKLPDTVNIEIEEEAVVYSIQDQDGVWWLINSDGKVVEQTSATNARAYTQVLGVTISEPHASERSVATESAAQTDAEGNPLPVMVTGAQRLNAALQILQVLESNDIVGEAASIDVGQLQDIILWYGTQYQVNLGSIDRMDYKIAYMKNVILQMSDYQTGVLDVSFTTWTDMAGFTPFG